MFGADDGPRPLQLRRERALIKSGSDSGGPSERRRGALDPERAGEFPLCVCVCGSVTIVSNQPRRRVEGNLLKLDYYRQESGTQSTKLLSWGGLRKLSLSLFLSLGGYIRTPFNLSVSQTEIRFNVP